MSTSDAVPLYTSTYGSLYFAAILSTAFFGVTIMQTFFYYVHYRDDFLRIKILVAIIWALDAIHEVLTVLGVYRYLIDGIVNPSSFISTNPELLIQYTPTALLAVITQGFLVYRIYMFTRKNMAPPIIWITFAIFEIVCGTLYVIKSVYIDATGMHVLPNNVLNTGSLQILATITLSFAAGADVLIAIFMTFLLTREWVATDIASTAHILQCLTTFSVNTGTWTALFALLTIILLHAFPTKTLYTIFSIPLGSVYSNTILANLNARSFFRSDVVTELDDIEFFGAGSTSRASEGKHRRSSRFSVSQHKPGMELAALQTTTQSSATQNSNV